MVKPNETRLLGEFKFKGETVKIFYKISEFVMIILVYFEIKARSNIYSELKEFLSQELKIKPLSSTVEYQDKNIRFIHGYIDKCQKTQFLTKLQTDTKFKVDITKSSILADLI